MLRPTSSQQPSGVSKMKKFGSLLGKRASKLPGDYDKVTKPEDKATLAVKMFCEYGAQSKQDDITHLPILVEAAETGPQAAAAAAYQIRKYLTRDYLEQQHIQYNAIMLIGILAKNPGPAFTKAIDTKFVNSVYGVLKDSQDPSVQDVLRDTINDLQRERGNDPNLGQLFHMWGTVRAERRQWRERAHRGQPQASHNAYQQSVNSQSRALRHYHGEPRSDGAIHSRRTLPPPAELAGRIEEAKSSANLLMQFVQSAAPHELQGNELIREFTQRCQNAQRSVQMFMDCNDPPPDEETLQTLIHTSERLSLALSKHQRAILAARRSQTTPVPPADRPIAAAAGPSIAASQAFPPQMSTAFGHGASAALQQDPNQTRSTYPQTVPWSQFQQPQQAAQPASGFSQGAPYPQAKPYEPAPQSRPQQNMLPSTFSPVSPKVLGQGSVSPPGSSSPPSASTDPFGDENRVMDRRGSTPSIKRLTLNHPSTMPADISGSQGARQWEDGPSPNPYANNSQVPGVTTTYVSRPSLPESESLPPPMSTPTAAKHTVQEEEEDDIYGSPATADFRRSGQSSPDASRVSPTSPTRNTLGTYSATGPYATRQELPANDEGVSKDAAPSPESYPTTDPVNVQTPPKTNRYYAAANNVSVNNISPPRQIQTSPTATYWQQRRAEAETARGQVANPTISTDQPNSQRRAPPTSPPTIITTQPTPTTPPVQLNTSPPKSVAPTLPKINTAGADASAWPTQSPWRQARDAEVQRSIQTIQPSRAEIINEEPDVLTSPTGPPGQPMWGDGMDIYAEVAAGGDGGGLLPVNEDLDRNAAERSKSVPEQVRDGAQDPGAMRQASTSPVLSNSPVLQRVRNTEPGLRDSVTSDGTDQSSGDAKMVLLTKGNPDIVYRSGNGSRVQLEERAEVRSIAATDVSRGDEEDVGKNVFRHQDEISDAESEDDVVAPTTLGQRRFSWVDSRESLEGHSPGFGPGERRIKDDDPM